MELGFAGDQLRFALVDVRELRAGLLSSRLRLLRLALELLDPGAQLRRARRKLQFPLVELAGARGQLAVGAGHRAELLLALGEHLLAGLDLRACLRGFLLERRNLLLALREPLQDRARFVALLACLFEGLRMLLRL